MTLSLALASLLGHSAEIVYAEESLAQADLSIDAEVLGAMGDLVEVSRAHPMQRLTQRVAAGGPAGGAEITLEFASLGRNLYGTRVSSSLGTQNIQGTGVTLCGLVELLATTQAPTTERTQVVAVPIGSLFLPLGIRMRTDFSSSSSVTRLTMTSPAARLCQPTPGMVFSYEFDTASKFHTKSGLVKMKSSLAVTKRSACTVLEPRPASGVVEGAPGEYLPVACDVTVLVGKSRKANAIRHELAYLVDAGFYVTLSGHDQTAVQLQN